MSAKSKVVSLPVLLLLQVGLLGFLLCAVWATEVIEEKKVSTRARHILQRDGFRPYCVQAALDMCHAAGAATVPAPTEEQHGVGLPPGRRRRHCQDLSEAGDTESGPREIFPFPCCPDWGVLVFCDQTTDGGGWTVFQRRGNTLPREDFQRTWLEYERGFGDLEGEFWLGLELLHKLTTVGGLQELRVDLGDCKGNARYAHYGFFHVGDASSYYKMHCGRYSGDAGDSLALHSGMNFTTLDADHDKWTGGNCIEQHNGPWWYNFCDHSNLNGLHTEATEDKEKRIEWKHWEESGFSLCSTEMKIKPVR